MANNRQQKIWYPETGVRAATSGKEVLPLTANYESITGKVFGSLTVLHIIGTIHVRQDLPSNELQQVWFGIGVFPKNMLAAQHPDLQTEGFDWMWSAFHSQAGVAGDSTAQVNIMPAEHLLVDVRAMRSLKHHEDQLVLVMDVPQTGLWEYHYGFRILVGIH